MTRAGSLCWINYLPCRAQNAANESGAALGFGPESSQPSSSQCANLASFFNTHQLAACSLIETLRPVFGLLPCHPRDGAVTVTDLC